MALNGVWVTMSVHFDPFHIDGMLFLEPMVDRRTLASRLRQCQQCESLLESGLGLSLGLMQINEWLAFGA